jgi:transcription elongation factor Elf1
MDPLPPGFVRVSFTCLACDEVDVLDLQCCGVTPTRLRRIWRCPACGSRAIEIVVETAADGVGGGPWRPIATSPATLP